LRIWAGEEFQEAYADAVARGGGSAALPSMTSVGVEAQLASTAGNVGPQERDIYVHAQEAEVWHYGGIRQL
jgi:hypothetical protein